jgi:hypothetical protein
MPALLGVRSLQIKKHDDPSAIHGPEAALDSGADGHRVVEGDALMKRSLGAALFSGAALKEVVPSPASGSVAGGRARTGSRRAAICDPGAWLDLQACA